MICVMSGDELNLKVVNGTSAPSSPDENAVWVNTSTAIPSWDLSAAQPARRSKNKNLFVYPYYSGASLTTNGVAFSCNSSGHVTANGTSGTGGAYYRIIRPSDNSWLEPGTYTLSGCPAQPTSGVTNYNIYVYDTAAETGIAYDYGSGKTFTLTKRTQISASVFVGAGKTASDAVFKPQLEKASAATSFVKGDSTGQVWIQNSEGDGVALNALRKNGIWLNLGNCWQYTGSSWVKRSASVYQSGAWNALPTDLVLFGSSRTDGWTIKRADGIYGGSAAINGDKIVMDSDNTASDLLFYKTDAVNTSGYTNLKITVDTATISDSKYAKLVLQSSPTATLTGATNAAEINISGTGTYTLKVPSGTYYVGIITRSSAKLTASKVWLE